MADESPPAVLVLAPTGKDGRLAAVAIEQAGIAAHVCASLNELCVCLSDATLAIVISQEGIDVSGIPKLLARLAEQPAWSDVPLLILTNSSGADEVSLRALQLFGPTANVTLIERPMRTITLVSAVQMAVRARRRQYEVRELFEQRDTVLASISDAFSALDGQLRYTYINQKAAEFAELAPAEIIGRTIWEVYPALVGTEVERRVRRVLATHQAEVFEFFYERTQSWMEVRVYPATSGIVIFRADISERKAQEETLRQSERKLAESEERSRLAIEAADVGTFDFLPLTREIQWSRRCKELFSLPEEGATTYETFLGRLHPDDRKTTQEAIERALRPGDGGRFVGEFRTRALDGLGERWIAARGRALFDSTGRAFRFIGTMVDITERKTAEIELQRAKGAAEEASRAKDQFLAMLSHELRTPLTPVLMTLGALRRDPHITDALRADLEVLHRNVELEALLIDDLLDLTRIAHGKFELHNDAADIHALLDHALTIVGSDLQDKKLTATRDFQAMEHNSWADAGRLQQVFWNLLKNAVKFTPPGGSIHLATRNDTAHRVVVEISDTGVGIDADLMPRIFEAFEQGGRKVTSRYGGLGLGLAIAKRVIALHGGSITAQSDGPGKGSTFTVTLDAISTSLLDGPVYYPQPTAAPRALEILLVEDHEDTARVLRRILENSGYTVALAHTVATARALAGERHFDLLISDVGLPDGTGLELMQYLQSAHQLAGIALSGFGTEEDVVASKAAGFAEHLVKPIDWSRLKESIDHLTSSSSVAEVGP
jgi:PAS domain S-box-containing protein